MNADILIPLVVAVVMAAVVTIAAGFQYLQAKLSILFTCGCILVLALVQLVRELRFKRLQTSEPGAVRKEPKIHVEVSMDSGASAARYGLEVAWMAGFGLTIYLFGFIIAIAVMTCAYMISHGSRWRASIMTGVLMAAFCYGIFTFLLGIELHSGEILSRLGLG